MQEHNQNTADWIFSQNQADAKTSRAGNGFLKSYRNEAQRMEQQLHDSFQRLTELEDQNRKLKEQFWFMKEATEKLTVEKDILTSKLEEKIQNINSLQTYLLEENQIKNSEWLQKVNEYDSELEEKRKQLQNMQHQYKEELREKEDVIYYLQEQLENEREKVDQYAKSDYIINQKLAELQDQNDRLEKDLIQSQTSLFQLHKSVAEEKIKDMEDDELKLESVIQMRRQTLETEADTTYAIEILEEKIQKLKDNHEHSLVKYKHDIEELIQFYENQIVLAKMELSQNHKPKPFSRLRNTVKNINQNVDNLLTVVKEQTSEALDNQNSTLSVLNKESEIRERICSFDGKQIGSEHIFQRNSMEETIKQKNIQQKQSLKQIILTESSKQNGKSLQVHFIVGATAAVIAGTAFVLLAGKRFFLKH